MSRATYYRKGMRVRIAECCSRRCRRPCERHFLATGRIVKIDRSLGSRTPVIQLDAHKKLLWGWECWWVPERIRLMLKEIHRPAIWDTPWPVGLVERVQAIESAMGDVITLADQARVLSDERVGRIQSHAVAVPGNAEFASYADFRANLVRILGYGG